MNNHSKTRPAVAADVESIKLIAGATELFPTEMLNDMIAGYLKCIKSDRWFVYEVDQKVVSFGFCEPERMTEGTWNLLALGVLPDYQGRGIGAVMMRYIEDELRSEQQRVLIVETMGTPEFERTREFYGKKGYVEEARIREFYEADADKIVFWKHL